MDASGRKTLPFGGRSREEYEHLLREKMSHESLRLTLSVAGLFQLCHEMLKYAIMEKVRGFYLTGFDEHGMTYDEAAYQAHVLAPTSASGGRPNRFRGSVLWLVQHQAITPGEAGQIEAIYEHRHDLAHELGKYLIDVDHYPDVELFQEAARILRKIHRFWIEIELQTGGFFNQETGDLFADVEADDVIPLTLVLLRECTDAVAESIGDAPRA